MATIADNRETITMGEVTNVIVESVATDKLKHIINWGVGFFAAFAGAIPTITSVVALLYMIFLFYKAYLDMQLTKVRLANEDRRKEDAP